MLTQANSWSQRGQGFPGAGNLYNAEQAAGWKRVVDAVHQKGTIIFLQLCHCGRATDPLINGGYEPLAPSAIAIREQINKLTNKPFPVPKAATLEDIKTIEEEFEHTIKLSKEVGFDGV